MNEERNHKLHDQNFPNELQTLTFSTNFTGIYRLQQLNCIECLGIVWIIHEYSSKITILVLKGHILWKGTDLHTQHVYVKMISYTTMNTGKHKSKHRIKALKYEIIHQTTQDDGYR